MDTPPGLADEFHNWLELPWDVTASILLRFDTIEILTSVQMVCSLWRKLCKDPSMWRTVHVRNPYSHWVVSDLEKMCRQAVNCSCGQLVDIYIEYCGDNKLRRHIANMCLKEKEALLEVSGINGQFWEKAGVRIDRTRSRLEHSSARAQKSKDQAQACTQAHYLRIEHTRVAQMRKDFLSKLT
ncbi:F-box protein SKIP19-like [Corylus avellana]|uniref:F-box protein SKIP19-like n=1 Tax=Corylus avellana TaxID=13451 RepID=UPI00286B9E20|nr:F-box protein SKIP19-like [Corylus avellana]